MSGQPPISRLLQQGSQGLDVKRWQVFLCTRDFFPGKPDGVFGQRTADQTRAFQASSGLTVDGTVGQATETRASSLGLGSLSVQEGPSDLDGDSNPFGPALRQGDTGPAVKWWQVFLCTQGLFPGPPDGVFGAATDQQTRTFQSLHGLTADGIVGDQTQTKAFELGSFDLMVE